MQGFVVYYGPLCNLSNWGDCIRLGDINFAFVSVQPDSVPIKLAVCI